MNWLLPLVGGLGIGSLLTSVVCHFLNRKSATNARIYQEKREAYLGLLDALHQAAIAPSDVNSKTFALWQIRVQLFGNEEVAKAVQGVLDTNEGPRHDRDKYYRQMIEGMRRDLQSS